MKILLVQPKSSGYMGQISKSGKAGFARVTLTTIAALTPPEHEVVIHDARLSEPDYDGQWEDNAEVDDIDLVSLEHGQ